MIRYAGDEFILFSDYENEVTNNKYYCVGVSEVNGNIADSINVADTNMLKSKLLKTLWFLFLF